MSDISHAIPLLKAMIAAEQINRDFRRKEGHTEIAQLHGDRAQVINEVVNALEKIQSPPLVFDGLKKQTPYQSPLHGEERCLNHYVMGWNDCLERMKIELDSPKDTIDLVTAWPRTTSKWDEDRLIWIIEGFEVPDNVLKSWCYHNMGERYISTVCHKHVVAWAKAHLEHREPLI